MSNDFTFHAPFDAVPDEILGLRARLGCVENTTEERFGSKPEPRGPGPRRVEDVEPLCVPAVRNPFARWHASNRS